MSTSAECGGAAWAFEQAMGLVWYHVDSNPDMSHLGRYAVRQIMDETHAFVVEPADP